ncbi:MAG: hypothetical protein ACPGC1_09720 [Pseudomonadales bacterium]|jgi:hypothetical protein
MKRLLTLFFSPLTFALGFLAPVIAQSAEALGWGVPGLSNLTLGLALALAIGVTAQLRGGWLWHTSKQ